MTDYDSPPNETRIERLYAFLSIDEDGMNGIVASIRPAIAAAGPLVTDSLGVAEYMKGLAQEVADATGKPVGMFAFRRETQLWQTE
jgi:hypothetical protein